MKRKNRSQEDLTRHQASFWRFLEYYIYIYEMSWNALVLICTAFFAFSLDFGFDVLVRSKALLLAHLTLREAIAEAEDLH